MRDCEGTMAERELELAIMDGTAYGLETVREKDEWKTKDGRLIPFSDIGDDHLVNILKMLVRGAVAKKAEKLAVYVNGPQPRGDEALTAFEKEFCRLMNADFRDFAWPQFAGLLEEAKRRGSSIDIDVYADSVTLPIEIAVIWSGGAL